MVTVMIVLGIIYTLCILTFWYLLATAPIMEDEE